MTSPSAPWWEDVFKDLYLTDRDRAELYAAQGRVAQAQHWLARKVVPATPGPRPAAVATSPASLAGRSVRELRAELERSRAAVASPAPVASPRAVSLFEHRRAVEHSHAWASGIAFHEAGHAVVAAGQGISVHRVYLSYDTDARGCLTVGGGRCELQSMTAEIAVAGRLAALMFNADRARLNLSPSDREHLAAVLGSRFGVTAWEQADVTARRYLERHRATVYTLGAAVLATGTVEGAELSRLLAPVRRAHSPA